MSREYSCNQCSEIAITSTLFSKSKMKGTLWERPRTLKQQTRRREFESEFDTLTLGITVSDEGEVCVHVGKFKRVVHSVSSPGGGHWDELKNCCYHEAE